MGLVKFHMLDRTDWWLIFVCFYTISKLFLCCYFKWKYWKRVNIYDSSAALSNHIFDNPNHSVLFDETILISDF